MHQKSTRRLAPRQAGPSGQTGETASTVTSLPSFPPSSNSSTFPIPPHQNYQKPAQAIATVTESLKMLYFGPRFVPYTTLSTHQFPQAEEKRARYHAVTTLHHMQNPGKTPQKALSQTAANLADLHTYHFFSEPAASFCNPNLAHQRGFFQRINAATIALPSRRAPPHHKHADLWIQRLPETLKPLFQRNINPFQTAISTHINTASAESPLPIPILYASPTEYLALLAKLEDDGMIHWSVVGEEPPQYTSMVSTIEMTLFSFTKSEDRSRLISWPRI